MGQEHDGPADQGRTEEVLLQRRRESLGEVRGIERTILSGVEGREGGGISI